MKGAKTGGAKAQKKVIDCEEVLISLRISSIIDVVVVELYSAEEILCLHKQEAFLNLLC